MKLMTAEQMREMDRKAIEIRGIPSIRLMEHASKQITETVLDMLPAWPGRVAVFCGTGNNGGDGIGAARHLLLRGIRVRVFLAGDEIRLTPDSKEEIKRLARAGLKPETFDPENRDQRAYIRNAHVLIDALFGVGLSRDIQEDSIYAAAVRIINESPGKVVSADIPSGIEADTGRILGCAVRADCTVTFSNAKIGLAVGAGAVYAGDVLVRDIGIPADLQQEFLSHIQTAGRAFVREALPPRSPDGHKGTFGKLLIVGGCVGYTGAPYLTASAAVHSGCGLVYLGVPQGIYTIEAVKCTSAMPFPLTGGTQLNTNSLPGILKRLESCDALALGPGLGRSAELTKLVCGLLEETEKPVVLDADGINALAEHIDILDARRERVTILTPHDGEFARLAGIPEGVSALANADRVKLAREFAVNHGCILVLKGHRTLTASPSGTVLVNTTGGSGLAKGGSGDILTGLTASLLVQGATPLQAAAAGVWLHGRAGDLAEENLTAYAMTPENILDFLPQAFQELTESDDI